MIACFGQTGKIDSLNCYTQPEMRKILSKVVYANECKELLNISETQLAYKDTAIKELRSLVVTKDSIITLNNSIHELNTGLLQIKDDRIKKLSGKVTFWKITAGVLGGVLLYQTIRR